jgi:hypothetical protein
VWGYSKEYLNGSKKTQEFFTWQQQQRAEDVMTRLQKREKKWLTG